MKNRYKIPPELQRKYLFEVEKKCKFSTTQLAKAFGICTRSYRDWRRGKFHITEKAVEYIEENFDVLFPSSKITALQNWITTKREAAKKGGVARFQKYGSPGTYEGRKKGGSKALAIMRAKGIIPESKPFFKPKKRTNELAEFIGILLGDGHIDKNQWSITLNSIADKEYSQFVVKLVEKLFKFKPGLFYRKDSNALVIYGGGIKSIEYFQELGLFIGNKIKQQVGVPEWIKTGGGFRISCLRGLMDTDGGIFIHRYKVNGKIYQYKKLCFVNRSMPLLNFVDESLYMLQLQPKLKTKQASKHVWLYNQEKVNQYLELVCSHNQRLLRRIS